MFTKIIGLYEQRKKKLSSILENRQDLRLENQHQIYGAINEIEMLLTTLQEYQKNYDESISNQRPLTNMSEEISTTEDQLKESSGFFSKIFKK